MRRALGPPETRPLCWNACQQDLFQSYCAKERPDVRFGSDTVPPGSFKVIINLWYGAGKNLFLGAARLEFNQACAIERTPIRQGTLLAEIDCGDERRGPPLR